MDRDNLLDLLHDVAHYPAEESYEQRRELADYLVSLERRLGAIWEIRLLLDRELTAPLEKRIVEIEAELGREPSEFDRIGALEADLVRLRERLEASRTGNNLRQRRLDASQSRIAALEAENARLRGAGAPGDWVAEGAKRERAAVLAYLRSCVEKSDDRRAATIHRLCEELDAAEHVRLRERA